MALGYDIERATQRRSVVTATGRVEVILIPVRRIALGDVQARDVAVAAHDIPAAGRVRGVLGLSFLRHFRTVLDYPAGYLEMS